jgi:HSP20 family protein
MAVPVRRREATSQPMQRWEPFREFEQLQNQMGQLLESVLLTPSGTGSNGAPWLPLVDIEETDDAWVIEAEVPGVARKDVNVELRDSELEISGEIKERERKGILRRRTRRTGRFEFRVTLPGSTKPENVKANVKDGVLTVRIPKQEQASRRKIEVQAA